MTRFTHLRLERIDLSKNEQRYYSIYWQPTLFDAGAVVRIHGRKGAGQRILSPLPYTSLNEAWPTIRALIRRRISRGYQVTPGGGSAAGELAELLHLKDSEQSEHTFGSCYAKGFQACYNAC